MAETFPNDCLVLAKAARAKWGHATIQTTAGEVETAELALDMMGAESNWNRHARGDTAEELARWPETAAQVKACNCVGCGSWGAGQVFMPAHAAWLRERTGVDSPCYWAAWLCEAPNAIEAMAAVLASQGPGAWSTYNGGEWLQHRAVSKAALAAVA